MQVKLVSLTQPKLWINGIESAEDLIAYCARVSNPSNQHNMATAPKLLRFLINNSHWSPFEMASMCVEIKTSRAIAAQILRHRSFSFQEFSQRYSEATEFEPVELRRQATKNRQSSDEIIEDEFLNKEVSKVICECEEVYQMLVKVGVAKECARFILPLTTQTTMYMTGTIRSWIHYLQIRCDEHVQKEHRILAEYIREIFKENLPIVYEAIYGEAS